RGQRPRRLTVLGSLVALLGLALVIDLFGARQFDAIGVAWGLVAAVGLALFFILSSQGDELPPTVLACGGMFVGGTLILVLGAFDIAPLRATTSDVELAGYQTSWIVPVLGLAVIAAAVPYVVGIHAARILGAKLASFVSLSEVIFAVVIAWALLGELPTRMQLVGAIVIIAGVALVRLDELTRDEIRGEIEEGVPIAQLPSVSERLAK
ncbi:MAG TPA: DMT family transporter, partial [Kofleriaceae bacterium]